MFILDLLKLKSNHDHETIVVEGNRFSARNQKLVDDLDRHLPHLHDHLLAGSRNKFAVTHRLAWKLFFNIPVFWFHGS